MNKESLVSRYIDLSRIQNEKIFDETDSPKSNISRAIEINKIFDEIILSVNPLESINQILTSAPDISGNIWIALRPYEPSLAKKIYSSWFLSDPTDNFVWEFVLDSWDGDQERIEEVNKDKIARYKSRK